MPCSTGFTEAPLRASLKLAQDSSPLQANLALCYSSFCFATSMLASWSDVAQPLISPIIYRSSSSDMIHSSSTTLLLCTDLLLIYWLLTGLTHHLLLNFLNTGFTYTLLLVFFTQDSDRLWRLTPPAQKALGGLLDDSSAAMSFSWSILRNAPPLSPHGSPMCQATQTFPLAPLTREHLVDILEVWDARVSR